MVQLFSFLSLLTKEKAIWLFVLGIFFSIVFAGAQEVKNSNETSVQQQSPGLTQSYKYQQSPVILKRDLGRSKIRSKRMISKEYRKSPIYWGGGLKHFSGFDENLDRQTHLYLSGGWRVDRHHDLGLVQGLTKLYVLDPEDKEFQVNDTLLYYQYTWGQKIIGFHPRLSLGASLPVSVDSQRKDVYTQWSGSLLLRRRLWSPGVQLQLQPKARYYWNKYSTTPTQEGDNGGQPLQRAYYGIDVGLNFRLHPRFYWYNGVGWGLNTYEESTLSDQFPETEKAKPLSDVYTFNSHLQFRATRDWSLSLSFYQGDRIAQSNQSDLSVFNEIQSYWSINTSLMFD